jgi:RecA-family ATPase
LWPDYIPQGLLTLIAGDPVSGKTTVVADLVGRYTTGRPFPDGAAGADGNVVIFNAEDPKASVMVPRLMLARADLNRIRLVAATTKDADNPQIDRLIALPDDLDTFERTIARTKARLAIVDPLNSYVTGRVNSFKDAEVRRMLAALSGVAERTGAAIIVVMHLNKGESDTAMYRVGGSIAYVGSARAVFLVQPDPEDETGERRVFCGMKNNYCREKPGLGFRLVGDDAFNMARVEWTGAVKGSAIRLLQRPRPQSEIDKACATLHGLLKGGERLAR